MSFENMADLRRALRASHTPYQNQSAFNEQKDTENNATPGPVHQLVGRTPGMSDYCLGTKFSDGDPCDQWAVGYYGGMLNGRHVVLDSNCTSFRRGGFRRCEVISKEVGLFLLKLSDALSQPGCPPGVSIWGLISGCSEFYEREPNANDQRATKEAGHGK